MTLNLQSSFKGRHSPPRKYIVHHSSLDMLSCCFLCELPVNSWTSMSEVVEDSFSQSSPHYLHALGLLKFLFLCFTLYIFWWHYGWLPTILTVLPITSFRGGRKGKCFLNCKAEADTLIKDHAQLSVSLFLPFSNISLISIPTWICYSLKTTTQVPSRSTSQLPSQMCFFTLLLWRNCAGWWR